VLLAIVLSLIVSTAAVANSYPGLHTAQWENSSLDILQARVAIEYDPSVNQHWFRLRVTCLKDTSHGQINQTCSEADAGVGWYDNVVFIGSRGVVGTGQSEYLWTGTHRTPQVGHVYYVNVYPLSVIFSDGIQSQDHTICTYKVTYQGGGSYSQGSLGCATR
jgi:hypothetical protein